MTSTSSDQPTGWIYSVDFDRRKAAKLVLSCLERRRRNNVTQEIAARCLAFPSTFVATVQLSFDKTPPRGTENLPGPVRYTLSNFTRKSTDFDGTRILGRVGTRTANAPRLSFLLSPLFSIAFAFQIFERGSLLILRANVLA